MAEDNVIRPVFGRKKPELKLVATNTIPESPPAEETFEAEDISELNAEELERAQRDLLYMIPNMEYVEGVKKKLGQINDYIFALADFKTNIHNVRLRRQGMRSLGLPDICEQIERSTEAGWGVQPSYFGALTLEYHYRTKRAISLLPPD